MDFTNFFNFVAKIASTNPWVGVAIPKVKSLVSEISNIHQPLAKLTQDVEGIRKELGIYIDDQKEITKKVEYLDNRVTKLESR